MALMLSLQLLITAGVLTPLVLMALAACLPHSTNRPSAATWRRFNRLSAIASMAALATLLAWVFVPVLPVSISAPVGNALAPAVLQDWLGASALGVWVAVLVQGLGSVIGAFSARYLQGEPAQRRYVSAFAAVLAAVHLLLLAQHWLVLIAAWAAVGIALERLLCFYPDRPFALLAAHKKRLADRLADVLLIVAAGLAWWDVGSGSLRALWQQLAQHGVSPALQCSAIALVLAVVLRMALLPVHGWLIQVMEAPTPVSALLHAGVVNLGGYVLIRFAPLLDVVPAARWLLVIFGVVSAVLAGLVMLTRISVKVRLAWSTAAQMGFMVLECGVGMYTLAALHLIGHSLYKAHAFLSASSVVQSSKLQMMRGRTVPSSLSLVLAPTGTVAIVALMQMASAHDAAVWPWWWTGVMGLAWAPLLWMPRLHDGASVRWPLQMLVGICMVAGFTALALLAHLLPMGTTDAPNAAGGVLALMGMAVMYLCLAALQSQSQSQSQVLSAGRRWSYAGFYLDEIYTRLALQLWPPRWTPAREKPGAIQRDDVMKGARL